MIEPLLIKSALNQYESIALGTLLQNVYTGIENIIRCQLQALGINLPRTENWHKNLLNAASEENLIDTSEIDVFRNLLLYRHRHIHGYGYMLDSDRIIMSAVHT